MYDGGVLPCLLLFQTYVVLTQSRTATRDRATTGMARR
jgi:hypothetical protein